MLTPHKIAAQSVAYFLAHNDTILPQEVADYAFITYQEDLELHAKMLMRRGLLAEIRRQLRQSLVDIDVEAGGLPEPTQLTLPGYKPPTSIPILQPGGEYVYVRFGRLTKPQFLQAIKTRVISKERDDKWIIDLQRKYDVIEPYLSSGPTVSVDEAIEMWRDDQRARLS